MNGMNKVLRAMGQGGTLGDAFAEYLNGHQHWSFSDFNNIFERHDCLDAVQEIERTMKSPDRGAAEILTTLRGLATLRLTNPGHAVSSNFVRA